MRTISILLTLLLLVVWIAIARYAYVCQIKQLCGETSATSHTELPEERTAVRPKTMSIRYNNTVILDGYEEFEFANGKVSPALYDDNKRLLDDLATYLTNNPERQMEITGGFRPSEREMKSGVFENLGLARANAIRQELVRRGISENRIGLNYETEGSEELGRPVQFKLSDLEKKPEDFTRVMFTFRDMTFSDANFAIDSDVFRPGKQFLLYADSVITFTKTNPDYHIHIIGHTDDDGNELYNETLGKKRAASARKFLKNMGIKNKIITSSKGESQPMAPNTTDANKQKNRRVNFVLKK